MLQPHLENVCSSCLLPHLSDDFGFSTQKQPSLLNKSPSCGPHSISLAFVGHVLSFQFKFTSSFQKYSTWPNDVPVSFRELYPSN